MAGDVYVSFGADTGDLEAALAVARAGLNAYSADMRKLATEMRATGAAADSELGQKMRRTGQEIAAARRTIENFKSQLAPISPGAKEAGDSIKQMSDKIANAAWQYGPWSGMQVQMAQTVGETLARGFSKAGVAAGGLALGVGAVAVAAGASLVVVGEQVKSLRSLDDTARAAKLSLAALQNLNTAGAGVGIDAEQMNSEMAGFADKLREAQQSGGELADFLKANAIAIKDAHGNLLPVQDVFGKIAELILSSNNEMDRLAALSKIGFSADTLRLIERQTDAVRAFAASGKSAQDDVLKQGMKDGEALSSEWNSVSTEFKDSALSASVSVIRTLDNIQFSGVASLRELGNEAKAVFHNMAGDAAAAAADIQKAFEAQRDELIRHQKSDLMAGKNPYGDLSGNTFADKKTQSSSDKPTIQGLYDKPEADKPAKTDRDAENAEMKGYEDSIAAAAKAEKAKETLYAEGAKLHILSEDQKAAATKAALDQEYAAEKALLQKELQIDGLKLAQKQAINDKLKALDIKYAADSQKALMQSAQQTVQVWDKMIDTMSSSMSSGIMGMINGTENFRQAMGKLADSVLSSFVKMGVDMVADQAKKQIALVVLSQTAEGQKTAAALAGASAREGIGAGEAAAGMAAQAGAVVKAIATDAGQVAAGVAAFLAPILGPAAPAAGAAAGATVMGFAHSYATGAWRLDGDQMAMLHDNEMVVPDRGGVADEFRSFMSNGGFSGSGGSSGGDTHNHYNQVHIHATDADSVKRLFANNSKALFAAMKAGAKGGQHL